MIPAVYFVPGVGGGVVGWELYQSISAHTHVYL